MKNDKKPVMQECQYSECSNTFEKTASKRFCSIECRSLNYKKHPLLNKDSKGHYDLGKRASIYEHEQTTSVAGMVAVCEFEIFKYKSRLGKKTTISGDIEKILKAKLGSSFNICLLKNKKEVEKSDLRKIETWKNYKDLLVPLLHKGHKNLTVSHAFQIEVIDLEYTL